MSDSIKNAIEDMQAEVRGEEEQLVSKKKLVNQLCAYAKMAPLYPDSELQVAASMVAVQRNSFFGRPLTGCVREFLEMRKRANLGPASLDDIFDALKAGGYDLETISAKGESDQKRGVAISLGKNSANFIRLPTDDWGLVDWYPNIREKKRERTVGEIVASSTREMAAGSVGEAVVAPEKFYGGGKAVITKGGVPIVIEGDDDEAPSPEQKGGNED